jgi:hypothetical protein
MKHDIATQLEVIENRLEQALDHRHDLLEKQKALNGTDTDALLKALEDDPDASIPDVATELSRTQREVATLERARLALCEKFRTAQADEHEAKVNAAIPRHKAVVQQIAEAMVALGDLLHQEQEIREAVVLPHRSYTDKLRPMTLGFEGSLNCREPNSLANSYIRECVAFGFLSGDESFLQKATWKQEHRPAPKAGMSGGISANGQGNFV